MTQTVIFAAPERHNQAAAGKRFKSHLCPSDRSIGTCTIQKDITRTCSKIGP